MTPLVVHIVHRFDTGGMENGMVNLINAMPPARYRHAIVCLTDYSAFRHRITAQAVDFYALDRPPGHDFAWMPRLWRLLRTLRPALVHTRNLAALEAQFVAAAAGVRATVHGEHGRDVFDLFGRNRKYNLLRRAARPFVSEYIAVSQDLARWLADTVRVPAHRIHQIYNGVDCAKFQPRAAERPALLPPGFASADSVVFGSVGRMAEVKDYPLLTRAFVRLVREHPQAAARARLVIVGEGVARRTCQDLVDAAGLGALAWLPGERADIAQVMRALDVFVLPSRNEGISNTLLEAQASGLPVVATRVGGNPELVEPGLNGLLVEAGDEAGMARALLALLDDPAKRARLGQQGRARVAGRFSIAAMAEAYQAVYERALARCRAPGEKRTNPTPADPA